ncbi:MAG TPA: hypothetical protein VNG89_07990 [Vicinamibacterales bacterium]|nr:hypothetical protein [Vicinamibacterales bacterium]
MKPSFLVTVSRSGSVPRLLYGIVMATPGLSVERLWSMDDGTMCLLVERVDAPRFDVCVMRGEEVLRQNRLYARGSAQMLAETWRATLASIRAERAEQIALSAVHIGHA